MLILKKILLVTYDSVVELLITLKALLKVYIFILKTIFQKFTLINRKLVIKIFYVLKICHGVIIITYK